MENFLKAIYKTIPFKKQLFLILRHFWLPPEYIYKHLHFRGKIRVSVDDNYFYMFHYGYKIENQIFWEGIMGYEKNSIKLWKKLCKTSSVIFDIGANTGLYSLIAKTVNTNSKVYAFDPVERVFAKLKYNCQMNNFDIKCVCMAISNNDGTAEIYDPSTDHIYSVTVNKNLHHTNQPVIKKLIKTQKLSSYIKTEKINSVDLMKIDVETHEPEVLEGMEEFLDKFRPAIIIEILNCEVAARIEKILKDKNYLYFDIDEQNRPMMVTSLMKSSNRNFLLCAEEVAKKLKLLN